MFDGEFGFDTEGDYGGLGIEPAGGELPSKAPFGNGAYQGQEGWEALPVFCQ